MISSKEPLFQH